VDVQKVNFQIGQIVHHVLFDYIGVIYDVDPVFEGTDEWYNQMARSQPPKDKPWYNILVHNALHTTYVAEQNLESVKTPQKIQHPMIDELFSTFDGIKYEQRRRSN